jgi:SAM-dependent methyltransferase
MSSPDSASSGKRIVVTGTGPGQRAETGPEWFRKFFGEDYLRAYGRRNRLEAPAEVDFIATILGLAPGRTVLDLCCGEGRHAVPLAQRGYRMIGLDLSVPLLAAARRSAAGAGTRVDWVRADSRSIPFRGVLDAAYCWFTSFGYFTNPADDRRVLAQVMEALRPAGLFLLEVPDREFLCSNPIEDKRIEGDDCWLESRRIYSPLESVAVTRKAIHLPGGVVREYRLTTRVYGCGELFEMMRAAGFDNLDLLPAPGYHGAGAVSPSPSLRIRARRSRRSAV